MLKRTPISAVIGIIIVGTYLFVAIFAPWIAPYGETQVVGGVWLPPGPEFWLGTDSIGRDLLTRLIYGARTTIFIAAISTIVAFVLGVLLGFSAAVMRGWIDQVLSRFNDLLMSIPTLIFALVVLSVLPSDLYILILVSAWRKHFVNKLINGV